ncbi:hypothetical protein Tco_0180539 [Tanacetum coccineum]
MQRKLLVLKQEKLDLLTMQHVNTEILKENQNLRNELKELTAITEAWLNSYNKVNQCISEQIPTQKKKILGIDQLTEDTSSSGPKDPVFVKSLADNSEVSITEYSTLSNHDTGKVLSNESQRNTTNNSVIFSDSPVTDYDSADESSVFSTPFLHWRSRLVLNLGNKSSLASKTNSAPAGKFKNVKMEDDPPLAIVMKELNELKLLISKNKSSYFRNKNSQQVPPNALQNKYKTQFKMNCELCGQNTHISKNCYEVLFCKKCKRTNHRTCDHVDFMSSMDINQYHTSQSESSSRSRPSRPAIPFPSCIYCGYNDHQFDDCVYYPICEICGSYDYDTHGKREALQAKKVESFKARKTELSSALRSKTPTKRYQANPKESHLIVVKRFFRYLDSDYAGCNMEKKSTLGACQLLGGKLVCRSAKKQQYVAMSSAKAEYVVVAGSKALENSKVSFSTPTGGIYGEVGVNTFRNAIGAHYLPHSSEYVAPSSINIVRPWFETIGYGEAVPAKGTLKKSLLPLGWREKVVPYTRFLSILMMYKMKEGYRDGELILYPTQVFSVNNWALKPNQPEEPPFINHFQCTKPGAKPGHKKLSTSSKQPFVSSNKETKGGSSKAPTSSKTGHSKKRKESSSAMDSNPSQPPISTHVDTGMNKEDQQATGGLTSVTNEARANPQLSSGMSAFNLNKLIVHSKSASGCDASADSTTKADPGLSDPSDFVHKQQGMNEGTKNTSYDHLSACTNPHVLEKVKEDEASRIIKLEDLAKLVSSVQPSFKDLDSPKDDPVIVVDDTDEDEEDEFHATTNVETEDVSVLKSSSPKSSQIQELTNQLNELLVKSLQIDFSKILFAHDFSSSLPTEMKDLPSKFNELIEEVKGLKTQVYNLEIEIPGDLKEIPPKLDDFTKTVKSVQAKLKTLDALISLLLNITQALNKRAEKNAEKNAEKENLNNQQPKPTTPPTTTIIPPIITTTTTQMQSPPQNPQKGSSQPKGEHIKKDKGKKAILNDLENKKRKHDDDIHDFFRANKRLKQDFLTIEKFRDFSNTMLYTIQEIFFRLHQGPGLDDHDRTFSSLLLAKRNLNPLKQMRVIEQLRQ